jgi:hypothetical protein
MDTAAMKSAFQITMDFGGLNALDMVRSLFEKSAKASFTPAEVAKCIELVMVSDLFCDEAKARFRDVCERVAQLERFGAKAGSN